MVKISSVFQHFRPFRALVLGDFILDTYTTGKVKRISPEAPVPVMEVAKQESRAGGAGNVVLNLQALGAEVTAVGRISDDFHGHELQKCLKEADTRALLFESQYQTPVKNRLIANGQQLLRVDFETIQPICSALEEQIIAHLQALIPQTQVVALSDYGKGFLTNKIIAKAIQIAKKANVPVIVDPKGIDFAKYQGATILKPNQSEAYGAAKLGLDVSLDVVAKELIPLADMLLITRSELGISLYDAALRRSDFPVRAKEVQDVTGAGDTVLAVLCLGLANGLGMQQTVQLANIAAGIAIERIGCVQVPLADLAHRLLEIDVTTKIFDESHTYALSQVLQGKKYSLLVLDKGQAINNEIFRRIKNIAQKDNKLIVSIRGGHADDELVQFVSSLDEVDYIIVQSTFLDTICKTNEPEQIFSLL